MPDVVAKLDAAGVDLLVQPELFLDDTVRNMGMWSPDNIKAAGYSAVLRSPGIDAMLLGVGARGPRGARRSARAA